MLSILNRLISLIWMIQVGLRNFLGTLIYIWINEHSDINKKLSFATIASISFASPRIDIIFVFKIIFITEYVVSLLTFLGCAADSQQGKPVGTNVKLTFGHSDKENDTDSRWL